MVDIELSININSDGGTIGVFRDYWQQVSEEEDECCRHWFFRLHWKNSSFRQSIVREKSWRKWGQTFFIVDL